MKVKCYDGSMAERRDVRRIRGDYYKHSDILLIDGVRHRCTNKNVTRDLNTGLLYNSSILPSHVREGFRSIKVLLDKNGTILYERQIGGSYHETPNRLYYSNGMPTKGFISDSGIDIIRRKGLLKREESGAYWMYNSETSINDELSENAKRYEGPMYDSLQYSMSKNTKFFKNHSYVPMSNLGLNGLMKGLTFGGEFETSNGKVHHNDLISLGIAPLRDGSISGFEYTTIPLNSIDHLKDIIDVLNDNCTITYKDALHFHIGGLPRSKEFLKKSFKLAQLLQGEFYTMVPSYKLNDEHHIKRREQNYTNVLPTIGMHSSDAVNRIVNFLSDGHETSESISMRPHPSDESGDHKWQIRNRYTNINFVNYIYGTLGTIEFRLHQGTVNPYKAIYWLLINNAVIQYAIDKDLSDIQGKKPTIAEVIRFAYRNEAPKITDALLAYVEDAKEYYSTYPTSDTYFEKDNNDDSSFKPRLKLW